VLSGDALRRALQLPSTLFDIVGGASAAPARPLDPVTRVGGEDRITTAVAVSAAHWPSAAEVLLATSARFPDALASGALAAKLGAPLLLTPTDHLSATVEQELARLKTARVWLLGGELALSAAVEQRLLGLGLEVRRLAGDDRYATAGVVARAAGPSASGEVALVLGADWPDAVAAGSLAATPQRLPTLLAERDGVPTTTVVALADLQPRRILLVGGTSALGAGVEQRLTALGYEVERLAGASRFDTAVAVAAAAAARHGDGQRPAVLVSGENFPDALPAGALAARLGAQLVLFPRGDLRAAPAVARFLGEWADALTSAVIVGGPAAVGDLPGQQAAAAISGLPP
jgi:putative cell wall-binding protein